MYKFESNYKRKWASLYLLLVGKKATECILNGYSRYFDVTSYQKIKMKGKTNEREQKNY